MTLSIASLRNEWPDDLLWRQLQFCSLQDICSSKRVDGRWHRVIKEMQQPSPWLSRRVWKEWWMPIQESAQSSFAVIQDDLQAYPRRKYTCLLGGIREGFFFANWLLGSKNVVTSDIEHVHIWDRTAQLVKRIPTPPLGPHAVCLAKESSQMVITTPQYTGLFALEKGETLQTVESLGHSVFSLAGGKMVAVDREGDREELTVYAMELKKIVADEEAISWYLKTPPHLIVSVGEKLHVVANLQGRTYIWNSGASSTMTLLLEKRVASYVTPLEENRMAFTPTASKKIYIFDINTSSPLRSYSLQIDTQPTRLPNQHLLLHSKNCKYTGWIDLRLPDVVTKWSHTSWVTGAVWSGYGPYVWTSCAENLSCWDVRKNQITQQVTSLRHPVSIQGRLDTGEIVFRGSDAKLSVFRWTGGLVSQGTTPKVKRKLHFPKKPSD